MKKRLTRREKRRRNKKILITSILCLLLCLCVGYAAFSTQLSLKAKGNIKERNAAKQLIEKVVTSGDGLYQDNYEENRYVYKGLNPSNYLLFNGNLWRIVSVEPSGNLKIVKNTDIGCLPTSKSFLAYEKYMDNLTKYYDSLSEEAKQIIVNYEYKYGSINLTDNLNQVLTGEKSNLISNNIGLLNVSDLLLSISSQNCNISDLKTNESCQNSYLFNLVKSSEQFGYEKLFLDIENNTNNPIVLGLNSKTLTVILESGSPRSSVTLSPVLYLKSDITLTKEGTKENPYQIEGLNATSTEYIGGCAGHTGGGMN